MIKRCFESINFLFASTARIESLQISASFDNDVVARAQATALIDCDCSVIAHFENWTLCESDLCSQYYVKP